MEWKGKTDGLEIVRHFPSSIHSLLYVCKFFKIHNFQKFSVESTFFSKCLFNVRRSNWISAEEQTLSSIVIDVLWRLMEMINDDCLAGHYQPCPPAYQPVSTLIKMECFLSTAELDLDNAELCRNCLHIICDETRLARQGRQGLGTR